MMATAPSPIPRTVNEHPRLLQYARDHKTHTAQLAEARGRRDALLKQRADLGSDATRVLMEFGRITPAELDTRALALESDIESAKGVVTRLEQQLRDLEMDGRGLRAEVQRELEKSAKAEIKDALREVTQHMASIKRLTEKFHQLRLRGLAPTPTVPAALIAAFSAPLEREAAKFGVTVD